MSEGIEPRLPKEQQLAVVQYIIQPGKTIVWF